MNYRKFSQNKAGDTINYSYVEHWFLKILSCIKGYTLDTFSTLFQLLVSQTASISKYIIWDQKKIFWNKVVWDELRLWDIVSWL